MIIEIKGSLLAAILGWNIVLYPFILYDGDPTENTVRHERCHIEQIERVGVVKFYLSYIYEFGNNILSGLDTSDAYYYISYEVEARKCEI